MPDTPNVQPHIRCACQESRRAFNPTPNGSHGRCLLQSLPQYGTETQLGAILYFFLCAQVHYLIRGYLKSFIMRMYAYSLIPIVLLVIFTLRRKVRTHNP